MPKKPKKLNPSTEPAKAASIEESFRPSVALHYDLCLKGAVGPVKVATATTAVSRMVNSLNIMGSELWSKLNVDNPNNLLDLGIHASVLVLTLTSVYSH